MKKKAIMAVFVAAMLISIFTAKQAFAEGTLGVTALASPEHLIDGQSSTIYIEITNYTEADVELLTYAIGDEIFQFAPDTVIKDGEMMPVEYEYNVSFGEDDSLEIPVQVQYKAADGSIETVLAEDNVYFFRAANDISIKFSVTPDRTEIYEGEMVVFTIHCENMGKKQMKDFYVRVNDEDIQYFDLAPNEYQDVLYEGIYSEDTTMKFDYAFSYEVNDMWVWYVLDPSKEVAITVLPADSQSQTEPVPSANTDITESETAQITQIEDTEGGLSTTSILLIAAVILLIALLAVAILAYAKNNKPSNQEGE